MFRPPTSPSTSTYNLSKSTGSLLSDNTSMTNNNSMPILGRKRTHDESKGFNTANFFGNDSSMDDTARGQDRYTLAGQINTPGAQPPSNGLLEDSLYSDIDYRRRLELGSKRPHDEPDTPSLGLSGLGIANSGTPMNPRAAGWTTFAFQAIGGVVGKVWEFCRSGTGAFRGFQAGGGKPYEENGQPAPTSTPTVTTNHFSPDTPVDCEEQEAPASPPGTFPFADVISPYPENIPTYHDQDNVQQDSFQSHHDSEPHREPSRATTPEQPAVKRRRTSGTWENDELGRHWVMVEEEEPSPAPVAHRPALNTKRSSAISPATSRLPTSGRTRPASRMQQPRMYTTTPSPLTTPDRRISAPPRFGFGSDQKSGIPPPRGPSRLSIGSNASHAGHVRSPTMMTEPASYATPRSPVQPETPNGSRIPQPRGFGPNPFANIRSASPAPRATPSRPSSRQSLHPSPVTPSFIPKSTPTSGHRRSLSSLSASRKSGLGAHVQSSPRLDHQAKHLVTKKMASEKKHDSRLDRLNGELQALIRQGQEALGTSFDVEMDEDERWEEA
ncbi:hypothetical protein VM1G_04636 [Cytospora mali]|uniref:Uncharacterized protein n=1 Tax=Cytospora mali TaxID=578113 RepID=A0A194VY43_CYTMA|nr:hypothetical protein VM1G_04636 [Valsa mali]